MSLEVLLAGVLGAALGLIAGFLMNVELERGELAERLDRLEELEAETQIADELLGAVYDHLAEADRQLEPHAMREEIEQALDWIHRCREKVADAGGPYTYHGVVCEQLDDVLGATTVARMNLGEIDLEALDLAEGDPVEIRRELNSAQLTIDEVCRELEQAQQRALDRVCVDPDRLDGAGLPTLEDVRARHPGGPA